ncbi:MAG: hypothetical protein AB7F25_07045 [Deferribacterales bacterium]
MSDGYTASGATISLTASLPATVDRAGFEALTGWAVVGKVRSLGDLNNSWNTASFTLVSEEREFNKKTFKTSGDMTLTVLAGSTGPGLTLLEEAYNSKNDYSVKVEFPNGDIYYLYGIVIGKNIPLGDGSAVVDKQRTIKPNSDTVEVLAGDNYVVTFAAGANGSLIGDTNQTIASGGSTTPVYAAAASGYVFSAWSDSSTVNPRTLTNVTANASLTASFVTE